MTFWTMDIKWGYNGDTMEFAGTKKTTAFGGGLMCALPPILFYPNFL